MGQTAQSAAQWTSQISHQALRSSLNLQQFWRTEVYPTTIQPSDFFMLILRKIRDGWIPSWFIHLYLEHLFPMWKLVIQFFWEYPKEFFPVYASDWITCSLQQDWDQIIIGGRRQILPVKAVAGELETLETFIWYLMKHLLLKVFIIFYLYNQWRT